MKTIMNIFLINVDTLQGFVTYFTVMSNTNLTGHWTNSGDKFVIGTCH